MQARVLKQENAARDARRRAPAFDLVIRDAAVIDGTGGPRYFGDIGIVGDTIVQIGGRITDARSRAIDAAGRVVTPGFLDMHSHVDLLVDRYPRADGMLRQGVTTVITGNCGMSPFPSTRADDGWRDLDAFGTALAQLPLAVNVAPLVGHGAVRAEAMVNTSLAPTPDEMDHMLAITERAMQQGAHGLSTGLIYDPGRFSDTEEIIALAEVVARYGGIYATHIRGEDDLLVTAVEEAIEIGRRARIPVQLSHHKAKRRRNWGMVSETLQLVDAAVHNGSDVTLDNYPYTGSSTSLWAYLPRWARKDDLLAYEGELPIELYQRLIEGIDERFPGSSNLGSVSDLNDLVIAQVAEPGPFVQFEGMRLGEAAARSSHSAASFVIAALRSGKSVQIIDHAMSEADMKMVFAHERCTVGSDARLIHPEIPGIPHPRNFGTFPRFLSKIAPELMSFEQAVHRCTGLTARRMGWSSRRGVLREAAFADLVMFDPERLTDHATFDDPKRYATGLDLVVVGGQVVIESDEDSGASAGRLILRDSAGGA